MAYSKILVSRTDRAGDLILTLPVFREIKKAYPDCHLTAHVRSYTAPLIKLCKDVDSIIIDDDYSPGIICKPLIAKFKKEKFDAAFIVHPSGRAIMSAYLADIPLRAGRASNLFMMFLNSRHIQHRSQNLKHEFEYNLDLLKGFADNALYEPFQIHDFVKKEPSNAKTVIIHPGSGGSAYNITTEKYVNLAEILVNRGLPVLVSLGPGEENLKVFFEQRLENKVGFISQIPEFYELAKIFGKYPVFVGGSTGPLHLAAVLGLFCVAFFPPVKAMMPERWGPKGCDSFVIKPDLPLCNGKCKQCKFKGCMEQISTDKAADIIFKLLF